MNEEMPGLGCLAPNEPLETTITELEILYVGYDKYDKLSDSHEEQAKIARAERNKYGEKIQQILEHFGKTKYDSNVGTIEIRTSKSWRTPKTPEQKKAFFEYLQKRGILWDYATVNANSLKAFCGQEYEAAKEENRECVIPGIEEPTEYKTLVYRPKK